MYEVSFSGTQANTVGTGAMDMYFIQGSTLRLQLYAQALALGRLSGSVLMNFNTIGGSNDFIELVGAASSTSLHPDFDMNILVIKRVA